MQLLSGCVGGATYAFNGRLTVICVGATSPYYLVRITAKRYTFNMSSANYCCTVFDLLIETDCLPERCSSAGAPGVPRICGFLFANFRFSIYQLDLTGRQIL
jgi:hypothetical protein